MKNRNANRIVIIVLVSLFAIYNSIVYTQGTSNTAPKLSQNAIIGEKIWQDNNCTACHQLYGLGGYLGPDLTNVYSHPSKGPNYIKAMINSGIKAMPKYDLSEEEKEHLVSFLKNVDQSGFYPNYNAKWNRIGWVEIEYKPEINVNEN